MSTNHIRLALTGICIVFTAPTVDGQSTAGGEAFVRPFSTRDWCRDSATACWANPAHRSIFNGVRLVAELDVSYLFQPGNNKFEGGINSFSRLGLEFNVYEGWAAFQIAIVAPGSITLDEKSTAVALLDEDLRRERRVRFNGGLLLGVSALDGGLSGGYGWLFYDRRDFVAMDSATVVANRSRFRDSFAYVALQPISSLRSSIKKQDDH